MSQSMGLREFGRWIGVSGEAVRKAIISGRIPASLVGTTTQSTGRKRPVISDPERARAAFGANTDPAFQRDNAKIASGRKAAARGEAPAPDMPAFGSPPPAAGSRAPSIVESRAISEAYKARLAKLEYEEKSGKLVNGAEVKIKMAGMVVAARNRLLGLPSKAKGRIPHLTVDEIAILDELVRESLEDCALGS